LLTHCALAPTFTTLAAVVVVLVIHLAHVPAEQLDVALLAWVAVSFMNTPVAFWPGTVARAHGSSILTWAQAGTDHKAQTNAPTTKRFCIRSPAD
jgi:hypothetical protein